MNSPWASLTGYDKIALSVVRAISTNSGAIIPLNVINSGNLSCLEHGDVVEVPCAVNANGAIPLSAGAVPGSVRELIVRVKDYERTTIRAALSGDRDLACRALAQNPLVSDAVKAKSLLSDLGLL
jgi:6-phospho-beta-glucosidase